MNELVTLKKDDVFTTSEIIAEGTAVKHHAIQQLILKYESDLEEFGLVAFEMRAVKLRRGIKYEKLYFLNEQQTTLLMTYMKNTPIVREFKKRLVAEFFKMREFIHERRTAEWVESRKQSKLTRKSETDIIKQLAEYAESQGSKHADMLYMTYSKLANKSVGISTRDNATSKQLDNLRLVESVIENEIKDGIRHERSYKEIYAICKMKIESLNSIVRLAC